MHKSEPRSRSPRRARASFDDYPRPSVAVDVVCLTVHERALWVLLYERAIPPERGSLALPGGFVQVDEGLDQAAARLLSDKAGLTHVFIEQLHTFGEPRRDPRGRVITVAYLALLDPARFFGASALALRVKANDRSNLVAHAMVEDEARRPRALFLDHAAILGCAVQRLRERLDEAPVAAPLLPPVFTLRALQDVHEAIRGETLNKDSFRRRMLASGQLEATGERQRHVDHRPPELFRFVRGASH